METQQDLLDLIDQIDLSNMESDLQEIDSQVSDITNNVDPQINFSLQKTAGDSYSISDSLSFDNTKKTDADYFINIKVSQNTQINGGSSGEGIGSVISNTNLTYSNPSLNLTITDPDVVETGILASANKNMSSSIKLMGIKKGNSYFVNLSSLQKNVNYYYKVYTIDKSGNLLLSKISTLKISNGSTSEEKIVNPDTGDNSGNLIVWGSIALTAAALFVLMLQKKKINNPNN